MEDLYDGIPVAELPITDVDVPDPEHLRRSARHPGDADIAPLDLRGLVARDAQSRTGEAIRVVGYSPAAERLLVVVLLPGEHPPAGRWHVVTAWPASARLRAAYAAAQAEEDDSDD